MGLSGGRKRVKIGHDPNNESWARSTSNYGHRMLVSQGWAPGQVLGSASNPEYQSQHLTDGSHSHIRVALRAENLGLGAKTGSGQSAGENFGLDAFQDLLGRLNGKSEETLQKEQQTRDQLSLARYVEQKGTVRFVRGGTLVSEMDELIELARRSRISMGLEEDGEQTAEKKVKREKKERREKADGAEVATSREERKKAKKRKKAEAEADAEADVEDAVCAESASPAAPDSSDQEKETAKAQRKAEKAERRERKRLKREQKAALKAAAAAVADSEADEDKVVEEIVAAGKAGDVVREVQRQEQVLGGRHASVRSRYIAAKRRAVMDPQALKEIFMVKA